MLFTGIGRTAKVDHRIGFSQQLAASFAAHAEMLLGGRVEKRPFSGETETIQNVANELYIPCGVRDRHAFGRVINIRGVIFDVIDIVAELPKSNQVMDQLPDHSRERVAEREMEQDDPAFAFFCHSAGF